MSCVCCSFAFVSDSFFLGFFLPCSLRIVSFPTRTGCLRCDMAAEQVRRAFQDENVKTELSTIRSCGNGVQFLMPCKSRGNMSWSASSRLHRFAAPLPCSFPGTPCGCIRFLVVPSSSWSIQHHWHHLALLRGVRGRKFSVRRHVLNYRLGLIRFGISWSRT